MILPDVLEYPEPNFPIIQSTGRYALITQEGQYKAFAYADANLKKVGSFVVLFIKLIFCSNFLTLFNFVTNA